MAGAWTASLALHDEASWRLPDWEAFSESGCSAWTDDARESDLDSDSDVSAVRVPRAPPMASTTTLTAIVARRRPLLPVEDLRALHLKFAQERQETTARGNSGETAPHTALEETQTQIKTQLDSVREELRAFQHAWQAARTDQANENQEAMTTNMVVSRASESENERGKPLRFDMAVQTDVASMNDDALRQWLHLITQKMEVLTTSFHGDTTQLPLRYPLQTHLERPMSFQSQADEHDNASVASWHVGGSLKTLVSESTAERLLDLERAVACLATATRRTTTRYVAYFENIVVQIQDLHQQRLRQVVDESLQEMKHQRTKYKKRLEQLETECRAAKDELIRWQQKAAVSNDLMATESERIEASDSARQEQWEQEREALVATVEKLEREQAERNTATANAEAQVKQLRTQLSQMTELLEVAQQQSEDRALNASNKDNQMRRLQQQHHTEIERLERIQMELRAELLDAEKSHEESARKQAQEMQTALESARLARKQEIDQLTRAHHKHFDELEHARQRKLQEAEETKREAPTAMVVDQYVQTDHELVDEGTTDERIARLKKRSKALESLLDKKFEDSSAASVASMDSACSGRWSSRSERRDVGMYDGSGDVGSRTMPLTLSFESSLNDTFTSSHAANTPSRDDVLKSLPNVWETASNRSAGTESVTATIQAASDPDVPSPEAMLALVRKLEALATSATLPPFNATQPDEEPYVSATTTPTRTSRPTSASLKKPGRTASRPAGVASAYSAAVHSLKDPRRQQPQSVKYGAAAAASASTASGSTTTKQIPSRHQRPQNRFSPR